MWLCVSQQMKVEIQYVAPKEELDDIGLAFFAHVFQKFTTPEELTAPRHACTFTHTLPPGMIEEGGYRGEG
jgi:hypothetical protein